MKYTTKQLLAMDEKNIIANICGGHCGTNVCPFKKSLRNLREDGFCVKRTFELSDMWIKADTLEIECTKSKAETDIKFYKDRIRRYKKLMKIINDEIGETK